MRAQFESIPSVSAKTLAADANMAATVAEIFSLATSADPWDRHNDKSDTEMCLCSDSITNPTLTLLSISGVYTAASIRQRILLQDGWRDGIPPITHMPSNNTQSS